MGGEYIQQPIREQHSAHVTQMDQSESRKVLARKKRHQLPQTSAKKNNHTRKIKSCAQSKYPCAPPALLTLPGSAPLFPESPEVAPPSQNPSGTPRGPPREIFGTPREIFGTSSEPLGKSSEHLRKSSATPLIVVGHPSEIFGTASESHRKPLRNRRFSSEIIGNPSESHRDILGHPPRTCLGNCSVHVHQKETEDT